jgi:AmiR/NasT family two-component response regulator
VAQVEQQYTIEGLLRLNEELTERAMQLERALQTRIVIEQAKGVLSARHRLSMDDAFEVMRGAARSNRMRMHDLARRVVTEEETPQEIASRIRRGFAP